MLCFTKQAARATSCVCVSQILLMSALNQPGPHPPPTNLHPPPRRSIKDTHTHIPISAHLAFQLLPHFSSPLPVDFLSLSLSPAPFLPSFSFFSPPPFISSLEDERGGCEWRVCMCVLVMFRLIQGQQQQRQGGNPGAGRNRMFCPHLLVGLAAALFCGLHSA